MTRANGLRGDRYGLPLSPQDEQVLVAVVTYGVQAAADRLGISIWTANMHLRAVREKLGASTTTHAAALAFPFLGDRYRETAERRAA